MSFRWQLFLMMLVFSCVIVGCCVGFQYHRERQFKISQFNAELQLFNTRLIDALGDGVGVADFIASRSMPYPDMRVTVIDDDGNVVYDNIPDSVTLTNHIGRPEIEAALASGSGYSIRRHSESTGIDYFYSATHHDGVTVRSAMPYTVSLHAMLGADRTFLWVMAVVALLAGVGAYFATLRMGRTISRLNRFAAKAERGEPIYDDESFPHDELGDISHHIVKLYARLQRATADLRREHQAAIHQEQEKIRIKKQLTNNINHELKTPVAAIQVCLETLMSHPDMDVSRRHDFERRMYSQTERLKKLLDDVSVITRIDDGAHHIAMERVDVAEVVAEAIAESGESDMSVTSDIPAATVVTANRGLIHSVFRNLIDNALSYSGGRTLEIKLTGCDDGICSFSVADDGTGVPPEALPHLFERFYRVDKGRSRKAGGTGLGLAIVKNAVMLHGGTITVANRAGGGLEFTFTLKRQP